MTKTLDLTKPVATRDGRPVRIVSRDGSNAYSVLGWVRCSDGSENPSTWTMCGHALMSHTSDSDLVNVPERHVRWLVCTTSLGYATEEEARANMTPLRTLAIKRIEFVEGEGLDGEGEPS